MTTTSEKIMFTPTEAMRTLPGNIALFRPAEAAEFLGVTKSGLDELRRTGELLTIYMGPRSPRFHRKDLLECAARLRAAEEIEKARPKFTVMRPGKTPKRGVYFIQAGDDGPIKIGYSANIRTRLLGLQGASPAELRLLNARRGGQELEAQLHRKLARHRLHHEWFAPAEAVLEEVYST